MAGLKRPTQGAEDANKRKLSWFKHLHPLIKDQVSLFSSFVEKAGFFLISGPLHSDLIHPINDSLKISHFQMLCEVLSQIPTSKGFFTVFANTSQLVPNFPPKSLERDPGLRCIKLGQKLFPPIYRIGTLDLMVRREPKSWKELVSPLRLSSYGSPFYGLYFEKALKTTPDIAINDNLMTAYSKLLCTLTIPPPHEDLTEAQIFALLGLIIQAQHSSLELNSELISNHAAHCTFISSSQKTEAKRCCWTADKSFLIFFQVDYTLNAHKFLELLYQGLAVECKRGQPGLDNLFTIYLAPESKSADSAKLDVSNITQQGSIDLTDSHKWSQSGAGIELIKNPYLILLFSLRLEGQLQRTQWKQPTSNSDS
ncbi:hypothetical protein PSTG_03486 [Puccinia striiformis f. sp. tritici PST-78]|uniref:Uncharacterized protein n=1 Tax=Puccinia striiformis f. sp. tritici PST-78 TaxID=1165861 RepID=A0A0L0VVD0_9BASI|nr:hypothetical protein PSTG_03486 [Puccinia striiformis f. sp. tritici PST-78]